MELVKETLSEFLSPDLQKRQDAKRRIEILKGEEKFGEHLTKFLVDPNCEFSIKELSATILKEWITIHWCSSTHDFLPPVITPILKHKIVSTLLSILEDSNTKLHNVLQVQAVEIFTIVLNFLPDWYNDEPNVVPRYVEPVAPLFCKNFARILKEKNSSPSNICLKTAVFKAITKLSENIPKFFLDSSTEILPPLWETFVDTAKTYQEFKTDGSGDFENKNEDSDDKTVDEYDNLVTTMLEFIEMLMSRPYMFDYDAFHLSEYDWFYLQSSLSMDVLHSLITFMKPTEKQIQLWANDPSQFIKEEEREWNLLRNRNPYSIRSKVQTVLIQMVGSSGEYPQRRTEQDLTNVVLKQFIDKMKLGRINLHRMSPNSWKQYEAYLLAFCIVKPIVDERWNEESLHFDVTFFLEKIVLADLKNSETHPLVMCQCLRVGRRYVESMSFKMRKRFVEATINCLEKNKFMCTRICAANSAHRWFKDSPIVQPAGDKNILRSCIPALFDRLLDLGNQSMSPEVLSLILENFAALAPLDKKATASAVNEICKFTVTAFFNFYNNHTVLDHCRMYFEKLALNPEYIGLLVDHLVPALVDMMTTDDTSNELAGTARIHALFLLKLLVKNWIKPLEHNSLLIKSALPALYYCVLNHNDHTTLINGAEAICGYLSVAALQAIECKDINGKTGSQYILQIASHLLKPESRKSLVKSACIIVTLLIKDNHKLTESIEELIKALITRLWAESENDTQRQLLVVCARLINTQSDTAYKYLSNISGPNGQSALSFIVYDGFCKEYKSFNPDERKLINLAFVILLDHDITYNAPRLSEVTVQEGEKSMEETVPVFIGITKFIRDTLSEEAKSI